MKTKIIEALRQLNPENDDHWSEEGLPVLQVVQSFVGEEVTREQLLAVDPQFTRDTYLQSLADSADVTDDVTILDPEEGSGEDSPEEEAPETEEPEKLDEQSPETPEVPSEEPAAAPTEEVTEEMTDLEKIAHHTQQIINKRALIQEITNEIGEHEKIISSCAGGDRSRMTEREKQEERMDHIKKMQQLKIDNYKKQVAQDELAGIRRPQVRSPMDQRLSRENKAKRRQENMKI